MSDMFTRGVVRNGCQQTGGSWQPLMRFWGPKSNSIAILFRPVHHGTNLPSPTGEKLNFWLYTGLCCRLPV